MAAGNNNLPDCKESVKEMIRGNPDNQYVDDIIFVGASTKNDEIWGHSNPISPTSGSAYGPLVDVFAPGDSIISATHSNEEWKRLSALSEPASGTSFVSHDDNGNLITTKSSPNYIIYLGSTSRHWNRRLSPQPP